jgi:hypothetical protein
MKEKDKDEKMPVTDADDIISEISGTKIIINTQQGKKRFDIGKLFIIDENDLTTAFIKQAASYAFFSTLIATAERNVAKRDLMKDQEYASADEAYRLELTAKGEKYTEAVVKSMILRDEDYAAAFEDLESAKYELNLLKAICKAYEQKGMMLQSLGSHLRSELSMTGMRINEAEIDNSLRDVKEVMKKRKLKEELPD